MSQSNTPNSTPYVKPGSVPQCLRHTMPCVPLEEAAWIAEFLGAACEALLTSDESVNAEAAARVPPVQLPVIGQDRYCIWRVAFPACGYVQQDGRRVVEPGTEEGRPC